MESSPPVRGAIVAATSTVRDNSAVAWGAVFAGAAAAGALSLILAFLGFGFGMTAISPWRGDGASAAALGVGAILWITLTQVAASSLGGYLAGRLRVRWPGTDRDEVYFRDTAHGFLAWAVATLVVAAGFSSVIAGIGRAGAEVAGTAAQTATVAAAASSGGVSDASGGGGPLDYTVDVLLRRPSSVPVIAPVPSETDPAASTSTPAAETAQASSSDTTLRAEISRALMHAVANPGADTDTRYLAERLSQHTGRTLSESEAAIRNAYSELQTAETKARQVADDARKAAAYTSLWLFISLLGGAFFAALFATFGGRRRDFDPTP